MTPDGPEAPPGATWSNPGLGQAGTVLLLVGWILGIVMAGLALLMGLFFLVWRRLAGGMRDWMMGPWGEDAPHWPHWFMGDMWGLVGWFTVGVAVLSFLAIVVGTVLVFLAWRSVGRGDHQRGGILGIVGGVVMFLFAQLSGIVAILGGAFVLVATAPPGNGSSAAPPAPSQGSLTKGNEEETETGPPPDTR